MKTKDINRSFNFFGERMFLDCYIGVHNTYFLGAPIIVMEATVQNIKAIKITK